MSKVNGERIKLHKVELLSLNWGYFSKKRVYFSERKTSGDHFTSARCVCHGGRRQGNTYSSVSIKINKTKIHSKGAVSPVFQQIGLSRFKNRGGTSALCPDSFHKLNPVQDEESLLQRLITYHQSGESWLNVTGGRSIQKLYSRHSEWYSYITQTGLKKNLHKIITSVRVRIHSELRGYFLIWSVIATQKCAALNSPLTQHQLSVQFFFPASFFFCLLGPCWAVFICSFLFCLWIFLIKKKDITLS